MKLRVDDISRAEWQALAASFPEYNYCQCWEYGEALAQLQGCRTLRLVAVDGAGPAALAEARVKALPFLRTGIAYVSGGPLLTSDDARAAAALKALKAEVAGARGLVFRAAPHPVREDPERVRALYRSAGFTEDGGGYRTTLVDITGDLASVRKAFDQKWRNCLNRSEREGLEVRSGTGAALFDEFVALYEELLERKPFDAALDASFYRDLQPRLPESEKLVVTLAYRSGAPVAGHVASMLGATAVFLLGAANEEGLESRASYLVQWSFIEEARRRGILAYDLGGIDPDGNPGVYHFKSGLGGRDITCAGPFEAPPGPLKAAMVRALEFLYRRMRRGAR